MRLSTKRRTNRSWYDSVHAQSLFMLALIRKFARQRSDARFRDCVTAPIRRGGTTVAPAAAHAIDNACPSPPVAPVMRTTRSRNSICVTLSGEGSGMTEEYVSSRVLMQPERFGHSEDDIR